MSSSTIYTRSYLQQTFGQGDVVQVDLGCGSRKKDGYIGVDIAKLERVDIACNLNDGLPFEENCIDEIYSNFLFEHIPDTIFLFKEIYRVCRNNAVVEFKVPYYQSKTQYKDPTHKAFILPESMDYFVNELWYGSDYGINTNFKVISIDFIYFPPFSNWDKPIYFLFRPILLPFRRLAKRYLWNVVHSITIKVKVIK
jgi:SAM-dependent methyltransferase